MNVCVSHCGAGPWRCFVADCGLPEVPGARRRLTQVCSYSFPLIFCRGRDYQQTCVNSQNTPGTPGTYGNGGLTVTEFESLSCWLRELAECRSVRARRVVAKWLIRRELPRALGLPEPPLEPPKSALTPCRQRIFCPGRRRVGRLHNLASDRPQNVVALTTYDTIYSGEECLTESAPHGAL